MKRTTYLLALISLVFLGACGANTSTESINTSSVEMIEDFPMEGSNTLTGTWQVDLSGIALDQIKSAKVKSISISMTEPAVSDQLSEIIVQLAASGASMQRVGVLNPVPGGQNTLEIQIAEKQENLLDLLKQGEITLVADINLKQDLDAELAIVAKIEFELEVKQ